MKYLFWNTHHNKEINDILSEIIIENDISIVLLAEYTANKKELLEKLAIQNIDIQEYGSCSDRIKIFGRIKNIQYRTDTDHAVIRIINGKDILCCVHLNSKIYSDHENYREILIEEIIKDIHEVEVELMTENTIVVGRVGAYCGNVYLCPEKCWVSDNAIAVFANDLIDIKYLFYLMSSLDLHHMHIGGAQPLMTQDIIGGFEVSIPSLETQKKVTSILSSFDAKIELNRRINDNLTQAA